MYNQVNGQKIATLVSTLTAAILYPIISRFLLGTFPALSGLSFTGGLQAEVGWPPVTGALVEFPAFHGVGLMTLGDPF